MAGADRERTQRGVQSTERTRRGVQSTEGTQRGVQSVEVTFGILTAMAAAGRPVALGEIAAATGLQPTRAHAHLVSLRRTGVVEQEPDSSRYRLGPLALTLGLARLALARPYQLAVGRVASFAERMRLMVTLSVWGTHGPTIVHVAESGHQIHANVRAGGVFQVGATATGRVFAAFLPASLVERTLAREIAEAGSGEAFDHGAFEASVAEARRQGFATTLDRPVPGVSAVAAPVFDHAGAIQLVATLIGPTARIDIDAAGPHVAALVDWTGSLNADLGFRPSMGWPRAVQASTPAA